MGHKSKRTPRGEGSVSRRDKQDKQHKRVKRAKRDALNQPKLRSNREEMRGHKTKATRTKLSRERAHQALELPFGDHGPCALLSRCRACPLLPLSPSAQRAHKLEALRDLVASTSSLNRVDGGLEITLSDAPSPSEGYRRTAKPAVRGVISNRISDGTLDDPSDTSSSSPREALEIGLYRRGSHDLINLETCWVQSPRINALLDALREVAPHLGVIGYRAGDELRSLQNADEVSKHSILRYVIAREGVIDEPRSTLSGSNKTSSPALYLTLVVTDYHRSQLNTLAEALIERCPELVGLGVHLNRSSGNAIFDFSATTEHVWGQRALAVEIHDPSISSDPLTLRVSAESFTQVNPVVAELAYQRLVSALDPSPGDLALDLYCGVGAIALSLARATRAKGGALSAVWGLEEAESSVMDARENTRRLGYDEVHFCQGRAEDELPQLMTQLTAHATYLPTNQTTDQTNKEPRVIVALNPSRRGCQPNVLELITRLKPQRIAYMSCNAKTLIRDLERLSERGYHARSLTLFDMFPGSDHYETVAVIEPQ